MTIPSDDAGRTVGGDPDGGAARTSGDGPGTPGTGAGPGGTGQDLGAPAPGTSLDESGHGRHVADADPVVERSLVRAPQAGTDELVAALDVLRGELTAQRLPLTTPGVEEDRRTLALAVDQLDDYLLPRLRARSAPLLVVVGGSTGAGKSTLVNSVLGEKVTTPGVLRPTTRSPVLVHHPLDGRWFSTDRILPGLARVTGAVDHTDGASSHRAVRLVASEVLPQGLALLDAPDVDSVVVENRELAAQLLGAADLWLFVTTAARYADAPCRGTCSTRPPAAAPRWPSCSTGSTPAPRPWVRTCTAWPPRTGSGTRRSSWCPRRSSSTGSSPRPRWGRSRAGSRPSVATRARARP
ncbi:dynamin family protein [Oerskovia enterophila]|uniref:dynamin family protein n=1 Tax=Oerskovia enterophila TaxID=43678 RepID=UPI000ACEE620